MNGCSAAELNIENFEFSVFGRFGKKIFVLKVFKPLNEARRLLVNKRRQFRGLILHKD